MKIRRSEDGTSAALTSLLGTSIGTDIRGWITTGCTVFFGTRLCLGVLRSTWLDRHIDWCWVCLEYWYLTVLQGPRVWHEKAFSHAHQPQQLPTFTIRQIIWPYRQKCSFDFAHSITWFTLHSHRQPISIRE